MDAGGQGGAARSHGRAEPAQLAAAEANQRGAQIEIHRRGDVEAGEADAQCQIARGIVGDGQRRDVGGHPQRRATPGAVERDVDPSPPRQREGRGQMAARHAARRGAQVRRLDPHPGPELTAGERAVSVRRRAGEMRVEIDGGRIALRPQIERDERRRHVARDLGEVEIAEANAEPGGSGSHAGEIDRAVRTQAARLGDRLQIGAERGHRAHRSAPTPRGRSPRGGSRARPSGR